MDIIEFLLNIRINKIKILILDITLIKSKNLFFNILLL